jgi:hypothetical protein
MSQWKNRADREMSRYGFSDTRRGLDEIERHYEESGRRLVVVMSHSNTVDAFLGMLALTGGPLPFTVVVSLKHAWSNTLSNVITNGFLIGCNRGSKGNTDKIVEALRRKREFICLIALAPTHNDHDRVRTGYFHVARQTQSRIIVVGFDYWLRQCVVAPRHWTPSSSSSLINESHEEIIRATSLIYPKNSKRQAGFDETHYFNQYPERRRQRRLDDQVVVEQPTIASLSRQIIVREATRFQDPTRGSWAIWITTLIIIVIICVVINRCIY